MPNVAWREEDARQHMQTIPVRILAAAARGEIDLNEIAKAGLRGRGLDHNGERIGFNKGDRNEISA